MSMSINQFTGNSIVDEVGQMHFSGNVIPEAWYQTITDEKGKVQMPAILILSEIVYWYRPSEIRNEEDGSTMFKKRCPLREYAGNSKHCMWISTRKKLVITPDPYFLYFNLFFGRKQNA